MVSVFNREKRLKRPELLELVVQLSEENDSLRAENERLRAQLDQKAIQLSEAGSIAEASLRLSGIFEAAQNAADTYLMNVKAQHPRAAEQPVQNPGAPADDKGTPQEQGTEAATPAPDASKKSRPSHASWC